jgi:exo-beta-1,3-glucanase (GH17 family)
VVAGADEYRFEGFDEPWKIRYNTKGKEWEDKWGLLDVNRKLKDGLVIPDCK